MLWPVLGPVPACCSLGFDVYFQVWPICQYRDKSPYESVAAYLAQGSKCAVSLGVA